MTHPSIRIEGHILSADLIDAIERGEKHSQDPKDFGFEAKANVKNEIADAWADARALWGIFQKKLGKLDETASAVTETRNQWLSPLLALLGYQPELAQAETVNGKSYAISHRDAGRDGFPMQLSGWNEEIDKRRVGLQRLSPHATLQEYLNLTEHLYGLVSNGRQLRLLRDSSRLIKLTYLEFDLERMFEEELFADFAILYRLLHASRMPSSQSTIGESIIERYHLDAIESGSRIRDGLRDAVESAMQQIATGLLKHPDNADLLVQIRDGKLTATELHHALLRLIYRLLFLMVIEERGLVHPTGVALARRSIYFDHYSLQRLRRLADHPQRLDGRKSDLWQGLSRTLALFEESGKGRPLDIEPLGSELFRTEGIQVLLDHQLDNQTLLLALQRLSLFEHKGQLRRVNYAALDVEELGSIYESLLELQPVFSGTSFHYKRLAGSERKTTGSYYTPSSLVQQLIRTALDPVLDEKLKDARQRNTENSKLTNSLEEALLSLRVCDPSVGSGAFLIAAAHHLAFRLAKIRAGEDAHAPETQRAAMRDVVSHCLFGVDINPLSVELCKVSLWLLAVEPGKPLSFLDHHIRCGNSLLGTNPALLREGIPQAAYKPLTGDTKEGCNWMKGLNKDVLQGNRDLFSSADTQPWNHLGNLPEVAADLESEADDTIEARQAKEQHYRELIDGTAYENARLLADTWCAAFVWPKHSTDYGTELTTEHLRKIEHNPHSVAPSLKRKIRHLAADYRFFHWHIEFPAVFRIPAKDETPDFPASGTSGGFDVMLGNPPWERVKLQEKEFFATRDEKIANAKNAASRRRLIASLEEEDPALAKEFLAAQRLAEGTSKLLRETKDKKDPETNSKSALYPLCGRGDVNLYTVFAELFRTRLRPGGRFGAVLPSGIATDDTTKFFFQDLVEKQSLVSLYDFENRKAIFPGVHRSYKFCLLTAGSAAKPIAKVADFAFFCLDPFELQDPDKRFALSPADIKLLNPNTRTCPIFRSEKDAELTKAIYRRVPVLIDENNPENGNPWRISFSRMFDMSNDTHLFRTGEDLEAEDYELDGNVFRAAPANGELRVADGENSPPGTPSALPSNDSPYSGPSLASHTPNCDTYLPLYEGRFGHQFSHRFAEQPRGQVQEIPESELVNPHRLVEPHYWVSHSDGAKELDKRSNECRSGLLGFRRVARDTDVRTAIAAVIPWGPASYGWIMTFGIDYRATLQLTAAYNSFNFDYCMRGALSQPSIPQGTFQQLPVLHPLTIRHSPFARSLQAISLELSYTAWDLAPFARDCGYDGPPFRWDEERRFQLRCELDALFFHLYLPCDENGEWRAASRENGAVRDETAEELATLKEHFPTPRDAVVYIMDTFPIVKRKDERAHGTYRTKDRILELYDQMLEARRAGIEWKSPLEISPASFRVAHPPRLPDPAPRATYNKDDNLWLQFVRQFLLQARHEANLNLLAEAWQLFANPTALFERRSDSLPGSDAETWKAHLAAQIPKQGFHQWVGKLHESGFIHVDRETLAVTLPEDSALWQLDRDEWINYEVSLALAELADRPDVAELLTSDTRAPEAGKILEFIAA